MEPFKKYSSRWRDAMKAIVISAMGFTPVIASAKDQSPPVNTLGSLREAITYLSSTFGEAYPNGAGYLKRLEEIEDPSSDEYKALQREALLNHPDVIGHDWLIEVRDQYWRNHGPMNTLFQNGDDHQIGGGGVKNWSSMGSRLEIISIDKNGAVERNKILGEEKTGMFRDADVSFDGKKILYSMRRARGDDYHLYEMDVDGGNVKQLTYGNMIADVDPIYLPDGKILFSSTRDPKFCQCNRHISQNLFRMDADGANILQVSGNGLSDFHSSLMPDGRVIYSRWEYVDRHFGPSLGLWTSNPDGTRHALFMGNNAWSPGSMLDARAIPGTDKVVCIYGATHDLPWGAMVVVDRSKGMEGTEPIDHMWPDSARKLVGENNDAYNQSLNYRRDVDKMRSMKVRYEDPFPVHNLESGDGGGYFFMVSKSLSSEVTHSYGKVPKGAGKMGIVLADVFGNEVLVYESGDPILGTFGALPIGPRKAPPVIPDAVDYTKDHGFLYVNDVYLGTGDEMAKVEPGSIKYLRIIDAPARRTYDERGVWNVDAQQVTAMNWNLTNNKRILGDVPVEEDGSAFFKIPADTFVQIHALDENKQMVQAMRSGTIVRPGETQGCIGCHEDRVSAPSATNAMPLATKRPPSELQAWVKGKNVDKPEPFNYLTEVQPILDKNCVSCHDHGKEAGDVLNLSGDLSFPFNVSYHELMVRSGERYAGPEEKMVNFVGDGPPGVLPAFAWGSHRSKLVRVLKEGHHDVKLSEKEMQTITGWIDVNAVYYGSYTSYYPGRNPILALEDGKKKNDLVFGDLADIRKLKEYVLRKGHLVNFSRPELSPVLDMKKNPEERALALSYIKEAGELLKEIPREDQTNLEEPKSAMDLHNLGRLDATKHENAESVKAYIDGIKYYQFK